MDEIKEIITLRSGKELKQLVPKQLKEGKEAKKVEPDEVVAKKRSEK